MRAYQDRARQAGVYDLSVLWRHLQYVIAGLNAILDLNPQQSQEPRTPSMLVLILDGGFTSDIWFPGLQP